MLGALFLGLAKRRHEITLLAAGAKGHRRILEEYDPYLLDQMIGVVAAATMVAYIIYCASPETHAYFGTEWMVLTTPFPIYGLFRYLYLVHRKAGGGSPSDMLLDGSAVARMRAAVGRHVVADHLSTVRIVRGYWHDLRSRYSRRRRRRSARTRTP